MAAGDVLVQIDDRDYRTSLAQSEARLSEAVASVSNAEAQIAAQQAQVIAAEQQQTEAEAALQFARQEFERAEKLVRTAAGTVQRSQQAQSQLLQAQATASRAKATVEAAKKQIGSLQAQKKSAIAGVEGAKADRALAQLNPSYTTIVAAQAGTVVKLNAAKGQYAQAGQNLMIFVPTHIWVLRISRKRRSDMRPGQPASIEVDAYPDREIKGHVDSIQSGSGTAFSLLPAENATGNFVKVVQRVPVKIEFDDPPTDITLRPGVSVVPEVKVR